MIFTALASRLIQSISCNVHTKNRALKRLCEESVLACDKCNYRCTITKTLTKHKETKHKISNIFRCEYRNKDHESRNCIKDCMKLQNEAFEEQKKRDIESFESIEKLLKECERDMLDDDDNAEIDSNSENKESF